MAQVMQFQRESEDGLAAASAMVGSTWMNQATSAIVASARNPHPNTAISGRKR